MIEVQSHNNHGLFRVKPSQNKKKSDRFLIRQSPFTNNSLSESVTINYRPQTALLRHRKIRRKLLIGSGDEKSISPTVSTTPKQIDFTELEQIFDNALRNRLSIDLYKQRPPPLPPPSSSSLPIKESSRIPQETIDTRIELSEDMPPPRIHSKKPSKLILAVFLIVFSALIGFLSVFIFLK